MDRAGNSLSAPGSTFKNIVAAAAIESGRVTSSGHARASPAIRRAAASPRAASRAPTRTVSPLAASALAMAWKNVAPKSQVKTRDQAGARDKKKP